MDSYIKKWNDLILNCSFDNTYKMAWAKALVELSVTTNEHKEDIIIFDFNEIAKLFVKYYWNQTIHFNLIQGSNIKKPPEIISYIKELISLFFKRKQSLQPIRFEKMDFNTIGLSREYEITIKNTVKTLKQDVCWRFKNLNRETYDIYELDRNEGKVFLYKNDVLKIKQFSDILFTEINYRWTQMLEGFNYSPRISRKVRAIDDNNIKRASLKKFHHYLDLMFEDGNRKCFYCGENLLESEISVDHVIPWSYMFSDDLWNLVYCHKGENSKKSNRLPSEEDIARLEERNKQLLQRMQNNTKDYDQLQIAVEKDYVKKFWISFKG
ncbi:HNH endonuclease domain-containing protein [Peribacillus frigoritolerans]|uniref:HNH endonuclease domain-containing protein n=1 Tax=Peribacillus frigoritolerans TaxID=450367 RepID=A0AAJ1QMM4_9BACI|nr:HNH endonuclease domain-containing protein [Peribacillus frigoritolerans]MDM5283804.1 HNH endonuclease domain-containing protein [Peribacillus frigoritolerans]